MAHFFIFIEVQFLLKILVKAFIYVQLSELVSNVSSARRGVTVTATVLLLVKLTI